MTPIRPDSDASPLTPAVSPAVPAVDAVEFSKRTSGPSRLRVAAVAGAAAALVVGVVATSLAASPAPSASGSTGAVGAVPFAVLEPGLDEGIELDHGRLGGIGYREITISGISGSNVTLKTDDGWTRTIAVTDAIELTKGGQPIALSDLAVGDQVRFSQTRNDDGSYTVEAIAVVVPSVRGTVSDVSSTGFKVTTRDGSVWTIAINGSTTYQFGTGTGSLADVTNGTVALVQGTKTGDNALTALTVHVKADRAIGTVTAKTADSITIKQRDGSSLTIHVDADTIYRVAGADGTTDTLADVTVGMGIGVSGRNRADGSIDADAVVAGNGRGVFGGHGPKGGAFGGFEGPVLDAAPGDASDG